MKFRKVIKNAVKGKSIVQKFDVKDRVMKEPLQEVTYAMPPLTALTYYYMQFVKGNFKFEDYPKYIKGTVHSKKVSGVFYIDLGDTVLRSAPSTNGERWKFREKPAKSKLPERKSKPKKYRLKPVEKPVLQAVEEPAKVVEIDAYVRHKNIAEKRRKRITVCFNPMLAKEAKRKPRLRKE